MQLAQAAYALSLTGANIAMGWLLYYLSEPVFGALLVAIGICVALVSIGSAVSRRRPVFGESA